MEKSEFRLLLKSIRTNNPFNYTKAGLWYSDELLVEESTNRYTNSCKKFELSKIQSVVYYKTITNVVKKAIYGVLIFIVLVIFITGDLETLGFVIWGIVGIIPVLLLIRKVFAGDTCRAYLVTAVGEHELESIGTVNRAKILMDRLKVMVQNIQGDVNEEDLQLRIEEFSKLVTRKPLGAKKKSKT